MEMSGLTQERCNEMSEGESDSWLEGISEINDRVHLAKTADVYTLGAKAPGTGRNMSGTLKGEEPFAWHVSTGHISGTCVMFLTHFTHM